MESKCDLETFVKGHPRSKVKVKFDIILELKVIEIGVER